MHKYSQAKTFALIALLSLSGCDTHVEVPANEISVDLYEFPNGLPGSLDDRSTRIGGLSISEHEAVDLNKFPRQRFRISTTNASYTLHEAALPEEVKESIYALLSVPELDYIQLTNYASPTQLPASKSTNIDSLDLDVYFFIIEQPNQSYPKKIRLSISIDGVEHSIDLVSSIHKISLADQVMLKGYEFERLSQKDGLQIVIRASGLDFGLLPISFFNDLQISIPQEQPQTGSFHLAGTCEEAILQNPCNVWTSAYHRIVEESEVRLLLLNMNAIAE